MYLDGSRSNFPKSIDKILELSNIPLSEKPYIERYRELSFKSSLSSAEQEELTELSKRLEHYIFDVNRWNHLGDILINMQKFFKEGVEPYFDEKAKYVEDFTNEKTRDVKNFVDKETEKVAVFTDSKAKFVEDFTNKKTDEIKRYTGNKAKEVEEQIREFDINASELKHCGEWNPKTKYKHKNMVSYGGSSYMAKVDNIGKTPVGSEDVWVHVASKGEKGDIGLTAEYKGEYNPNLRYEAGDMVSYGGYIYFANEVLLGVPPTEDGWVLYNGEVYIGDLKPFDERLSLWIDIS